MDSDLNLIEIGNDDPEDLGITDETVDEESIEMDFFEVFINEINKDISEDTSWHGTM